MEDPCKSDNLYPKVNELVNSSVINNSEIRIKRANKIQDFWLKNNAKGTKEICRYINFLEFFYINLVVLSITSGCVIIALFISAIGAPVGLLNLFIAILFTLGNGFVNLFLSMV